jgi:hypothetical protein
MVPILQPYQRENLRSANPVWIFLPYVSPLLAKRLASQKGSLYDLIVSSPISAEFNSGVRVVPQMMPVVT